MREITKQQQQIRAESGYMTDMIAATGPHQPVVLSRNKACQWKLFPGAQLSNESARQHKRPVPLAVRQATLKRFRLASGRRMSFQVKYWTRGRKVSPMCQALKSPGAPWVELVD